MAKEILHFNNKYKTQLFNVHASASFVIISLKIYIFGAAHDGYLILST